MQALLATALFALAPGAAAQTEVPLDWALKPSGLGVGAQFRMIFIARDTLQATSSDLSTYDAHVQAAAAKGHAAIQGYSSQFRAIGCTLTTDARTHTGTTGAGTGIKTYWLGGAAIATGYLQIFTEWSNHGTRDLAGNFSVNEDGVERRNGAVWTGCQRLGTVYTTGTDRWALGQHRVSFGVISRGLTMSTYHKRNNLYSRLYALSSLFEVVANSTITISGGGPVTEGAPASFTLNASPAPGTDLTVTLSVSELTAGGQDFVAASEEGAQTVTILANATSATFTVPTVDDSTDEPDGAVTATVVPSTATPAAYTVGSTPSASVTVMDDDGPPTIAISGGGAVTEGAAAMFTVNASSPSAADLTVDLNVTESGSFISSGQGGSRTVTIPSGMTSATLTVDTEDDNVDEPDGSVTATLANGSGYAVGAPSSASVTVNDNDDSTPEITIVAGAAVTEGAAATFTVNASPVPTANLTVNLNVTQSGNFVSSGQGGSRTVTISSGTSSATLSVGTNDDSTDEPNGSVTATVLSSTAIPAAYTVGSPGSASVTVSDNDDPPLPAITVTGGSAITEGATANFTLFASPAPSSNLTVDLNVTQSGSFISSGQGGSRTATFLSGVSSAPLTVGTDDDSTDEPDGSVTATVTSGQGYTAGSTSSASVTVNDNDLQLSTPPPSPPVAPPPSPPAVRPAASFALSTSSVAEGEGPVNVTIQISPAPPSEIMLAYDVGGTATANADYAELSGTVEAASGKTSVAIPVDIIDDRAAEDDETLVLTLKEGSGYAVRGAGPHTLTIQDDDDFITITSAEGAGEEIPEAFALEQNYPNPFNPSTTIEFSLDKAQRVSLAVYDMLGHEVRTLMEGVQPAANYRVSFDASDLPSGAYLYVLRAEEETAVKKMSLLK